MPPVVVSEIEEEEGIPRLYLGPGEKVARAEVREAVAVSNCTPLKVLIRVDRR